MKTSTVHSLVTARVLFDEGRRLVESGDRHMCSAGLLMIQDSLEIVFLALLTERDVDEQKKLDRKSFDELISELNAAGVTVPKSGTLKALNRQRVITKHYGQLAEPGTVQGYLESVEPALDSILRAVVGKTMREIVLTDLLDKGEAREFLTLASRLIDERKPDEALVAVRKAIFVEIEADYAIDGWTDVESESGEHWFAVFARGGRKAPHWTRNKAWISAHVKKPVDYVQIDYEQFRIDAMEWGVNTAELHNLRRLTPDVVRLRDSGLWCMELKSDSPAAAKDLATARYCLDRAISILLRKHQHRKATRFLTPGRLEKPLALRVAG